MDDAALWVLQAERDLEAARYNLTGGHHAVAAFLAQQAGEKALKAVFIAKRQSLWRIHNLVSLAQSVEAPQGILEHAKVLTPHYVATRYPTEKQDEYRGPEARDAVRRAEEVVAWAKSQV